MGTGQSDLGVGRTWFHDELEIFERAKRVWGGFEIGDGVSTEDHKKAYQAWKDAKVRFKEAQDRYEAELEAADEQVVTEKEQSQ